MVFSYYNQDNFSNKSAREQCALYTYTVVIEANTVWASRPDAKKTENSSGIGWLSKNIAEIQRK